MSERKLASIRRIAEVKSIPDADRIVAYRVDGWWVVDSKDKYQVGDLVIYIEPDAWVPTEIAAFLSKGKEPRVYNGVPGEKLRTVRLKKQLSQGLLLPYDTVAGKYFIQVRPDAGPDENLPVTFDEGDDVTSLLGIQKWEPPMSVELAGMAKGNFPSAVQKTDEERAQNLVRNIEQWYHDGITWEVSEKCEGTSFTAFLKDGEFNVCSRNINLKETEDNLYWQIARKYDIEAKMRSLELDNIAVQGEIYGSGIQGNIYKMNNGDQRLAVFTIQLNGQKVTPELRRRLVEKMGLDSIAIMHHNYTLPTGNVDDLLALADGQSVYGPQGVLREGLVYKSTCGQYSFKTVSNKYLEKQKD